MLQEDVLSTLLENNNQNYKKTNKAFDWHLWSFFVSTPPNRQNKAPRLLLNGCLLAAYAVKTLGATKTARVLVAHDRRVGASTARALVSSGDTARVSSLVLQEHCHSLISYYLFFSYDSPIAVLQEYCFQDVWPTFVLHACMNANIQTFKHTGIHTSILPFLHTFVHTCMHAYIPLNLHTFLHTCTHTSMQTHTQTCRHTHTQTCRHTQTCIHANIHTCMQS